MYAPINEDFFDIVEFKDYSNAVEGEVGGALFKIRVTDFTSAYGDKQLICLSISHGIADAKSLGVFMKAWSNAFKGEPLPNVSHDHSVIPPAVSAFGAPAIVETNESTPQSWIKSSKPFAMP